MTWAAPKAGLKSRGSWVAPLSCRWGRVKPANGGVYSTVSYVGNKWKLIKRKASTNGTVQHALSRIDAHVGYYMEIKLHSARNFPTTCTSQLRFPLEQRGKLGWRAKGSIMPDRYDRALCATELRLPGDIIDRITQGRRPQCAFEVPPTPPTRRGKGLTTRRLAIRHRSHLLRLPSFGGGRQFQI